MWLSFCSDSWGIEWAIHSHPACHRADKQENITWPHNQYETLQGTEPFTGSVCSLFAGYLRIKRDEGWWALKFNVCSGPASQKWQRWVRACDFFYSGLTLCGAQHAARALPEIPKHHWLCRVSLNGIGPERFGCQRLSGRTAEIINVTLPNLLGEGNATLRRGGGGGDKESSQSFIWPLRGITLKGWE